MIANGYRIFLPGRVMKMFWGWMHDPVNRLTPTELHTLRECILWYVNYISALKKKKAVQLLKAVLAI